MNLNDLAKEITLQEGKKISISIAQVKEVMKILLSKLALLDEEEAIRIINRYRVKIVKK